jgi:predicted transcriptional regulator
VSNEPPHGDATLIDHTAEIVAAYVQRNPVSPADLIKVISLVHRGLMSAASPPALIQKPVPAVPVKQAVTASAIICLEDGKGFKSLKRHLRTHHDMTPEQYREKWKLPPSFPMVAQEYSSRRSLLAKGIGLGRSRAGKARSTKPAKGRIDFEAGA